MGSTASKEILIRFNVTLNTNSHMVTFSFNGVGKSQVPLKVSVMSGDLILSRRETFGKIALKISRVNVYLYLV